MKKELKGFAAGVIIAAIGTTAVSAAVEQFTLVKATYPITINGVSYSDPNLPILNYKGSTYAPLNSMLTAAGLKVGFVDGKVVVGENKPAEGQVKIEVGGKEVFIDKESVEEVETLSGSPAQRITYNGEEYLTLRHIADIYKGVFFVDWDAAAKKVTLFTATWNRDKMKDENVKILCELGPDSGHRILSPSGYTLISNDFIKSEILPLIQPSA